MIYQPHRFEDRIVIRPRGGPGNETTPVTFIFDHEDSGSSGSGGSVSGWSKRYYYPSDAEGDISNSFGSAKWVAGQNVIVTSIDSFIDWVSTNYELDSDDSVTNSCSSSRSLALIAVDGDLNELGTVWTMTWSYSGSSINRIIDNLHQPWEYAFAAGTGGTDGSYTGPVHAWLMSASWSQTITCDKSPSAQYFASTWLYGSAVTAIIE